MKRKCYNCEKVKEGSTISTGVFVCNDCQLEQDAYDISELEDQANRGIITPAEYKNAFGKDTAKEILSKQKPVCEHCGKALHWSPTGRILTCKCRITRVSYHDLTVIARSKGIEFKTLGRGLQWAKDNGYKVVDAHNRRDDADRQVGLKL